MATKSKGKASVSTLAQQLIAGTNKHLANTAQLLIAGGSFTPAQVTTKLQAIVNLRSDVNAARATTKAKVAAEATDMAPLRTFMDAFVTFVKAAFGSAPDVLADFGIQPKSRTPLTVEAKAAAAAKRAATRVARNTMGPKQRLPLRRGTSGIRPRFALRAASAWSR